MKSNRLFILGIDGATFDLLDPWLEQGKLPHFAHIIKKGCRGTLTSTIPPISCMAWPSMVTGVNPGKHGIFDWMEIPKGGQEERFVAGSNSRRAPALWNLLSADGYRVGIFNVPMTYPPEKVNGFMVSGMDAPRASAYPPEMINKLNKVCGNYMVDVYRHDYEKIGDLEIRLQLVEDMMTSRRAALFHLLDHESWDFFMVVFVFADRLLHKFWSLWDSTHPLYDPELAERYGDRLLYHFQRMDEILGELLHRFKDEVNLLIVSDHGFGPNHKIFSVNNFLRQIGVLQVTTFTGNDKVLSQEETLSLKMVKALRRLVSNRIGRSWKEAVRRIMGKHIREYVDTTFPVRPQHFSVKNHIEEKKINLSASRAFTMPHTGNIYINLKGKFQPGLVEPGREYEDLRNYIVKKLYDLKDPETQEPVMEKVYKKEEIFWGNYMEIAPDILLVTRDRKYLIFETYDYLENYDEYRIVRPLSQKLKMDADHRMNGILMAYGPDIAEGVKVEGAQITDIAPTVLHLLSAPVSPEMDGQILFSLLKEEFKSQRPVIYREKTVTASSQKEPPCVYSPEEAEEIRQRLKSIGYLS